MLSYLGKVKYKIMKSGFPVQNEVKFYYVTTEDNQVVLSNEHVDFVWVYYEQARKLPTFSQSKLILDKILKYVYCPIKKRKGYRYFNLYYDSLIIIYFNCK
jgi:hypothetical protein